MSVDPYLGLQCVCPDMSVDPYLGLQCVCPDMSVDPYLGLQCLPRHVCRPLSGSTMFAQTCLSENLWYYNLHLIFCTDISVFSPLPSILHVYRNHFRRNCILQCYSYILKLCLNTVSFKYTVFIQFTFNSEFFK